MLRFFSGNPSVQGGTGRGHSNAMNLLFRMGSKLRFAGIAAGLLFTFVGSRDAQAQFPLPAIQPSPPLLAPPPPPTPAANQTTQELEASEREDSGRRLQFVWLNPEVGFQWASLGGLSNSKLVEGTANPRSSGLVVGGGAGVRLLYLTLGARFRYGLLADYHLWSLALEGALKIPYGKTEPYVFVNAGYGQAGGFHGGGGNEVTKVNTSSVQMGGITAALGVGLDYFVTPVFSVGPRLEAQALFLSRAATKGTGSSFYDDKGSGIGIATSGMLVLGLHF
ncbi:MAG TPA: hypothetical protein VHM70_16155 [Polyangiaceae bacterium]|jgi:hypothetical protein|nr:hypothetical protein [Polyangiaceae bacterium]